MKERLLRLREVAVVKQRLYFLASLKCTFESVLVFQCQEKSFARGQIRYCCNPSHSW